MKKAKAKKIIKLILNISLYFAIILIIIAGIVNLFNQKQVPSYLLGFWQLMTVFYMIMIILMNKRVDFYHNIKNEDKEIYKEIEPILEDFEATGITLIQSGLFENTGKKVLEHIGFIRGAFYKRIKKL